LAAVRDLAAVAAAAAIAALGALLLGEYELDGATPLIAGVLFGLVLAEVVVAVRGRSDVPTAVVSAVLAAAGMVGAAWISSGNDWSFVPALGWVGVAVGAAAAAAWVRAAGRRARGSPRAP
jgi:hypothetical protein